MHTVQLGTVAAYTLMGHWVKPSCIPRHQWPGESLSSWGVRISSRVLGVIGCVNQLENMLRKYHWSCTGSTFLTIQARGSERIPTESRFAIGTFLLSTPHPPVHRGSPGGELVSLKFSFFSWHMTDLLWKLQSRNYLYWLKVFIFIFDQNQSNLWKAVQCCRPLQFSGALRVSHTAANTVCIVASLIQIFLWCKTPGFRAKKRFCL